MDVAALRRRQPCRCHQQLWSWYLRFARQRAGEKERFSAQAWRNRRQWRPVRLLEDQAIFSLVERLSGMEGERLCVDERGLWGWRRENAILWRSATLVRL